MNDDPVSQSTFDTLERLAAQHGRPAPRLTITEKEAKDAIRWLTKLRRDGGEHDAVPIDVTLARGEDVREPAPDQQPGETLRGWRPFGRFGQ